MDHSPVPPNTIPGEASDSGELRSWFGFWVPFVILALLVVIGVIVAGQGGGPGDDTTGLLLSLAAIALAFMLLKHRLDGGAGGWSDFLLVDTMGNLVFAVVALVILGLIGLFVAAGAEYGSLHDAGVALFLAAGLMIFFSLKRVFDRIDARH